MKREVVAGHGLLVAGVTWKVQLLPWEFCKLEGSLDFRLIFIDFFLFKRGCFFKLLFSS